MKDGRVVAGWVERVRIYPGRLSIRAKLDSGAKHSSLHAGQVTEFLLEGVPWVRFRVTDKKGRTESFEERVVRFTRIKDHGRPSATRPVIRLRICLGGQMLEGEVNLVDRTGFNYRMLLGRSMLAGRFLVDPSASFLLKPDCRELLVP